MKENSQNHSAFGFVLALIIYLFMGLIAGKENFWGIVMWIAVSAVAIFLMSVVIVFLQIVNEKNSKDENEETPSN